MESSTPVESEIRSKAPVESDGSAATPALDVDAMKRGTENSSSPNLPSFGRLFFAKQQLRTRPATPRTPHVIPQTMTHLPSSSKHRVYPYPCPATHLPSSRKHRVYHTANTNPLNLTSKSHHSLIHPLLALRRHRLLQQLGQFGEDARSLLDANIHAGEAA